MPPYVQNTLSPAELAFLHSSLSLTPPVRPDARTSTQFRPLVAETNILPGTNGSARICFADGTEAIVGVKAEIEKTGSWSMSLSSEAKYDAEDGSGEQKSRHGQSQWVQMSIEIPGYREDDPLPIFLSAMLHESLVAGGELSERLFISPSWHWKIYVDVLLLSPPLSYPVPLLSLTIHLALLSTRLPALKSEQDEDPFFDDDWDVSKHLYHASEVLRPPVTLLVASVGQNVLFDPCKEEVAVADALLAVSFSRSLTPSTDQKYELRLLSIRTIDNPSKMTSAGVPDSENSKVLSLVRPDDIDTTSNRVSIVSSSEPSQGLWKPHRGGMPRWLLCSVVKNCLSTGGVGEEVLAALQAVDIR